MDEIPADAALGNGATTEGQTTKEQKEVDWEKRYKDSQKYIEYTSIENKRLKARNDAITKQLKTSVVGKVEIPKEIDDLQHSDPQKWRSEVNKLEQEANAEALKAHTEAIDSATTEAEQTLEVDRRKRVFEQFQTDNANLGLTLEQITQKVPLEYSQKLENGEITFDDYLNKAKIYLTSDRVPHKEELQGDPDLNGQPGGAKPSHEAIKSDFHTSYKTEIY